MPEMSNAFIPKHKGEKEPREKILKLGKKLPTVFLTNYMVLLLMIQNIGDLLV